MLDSPRPRRIRPSILAYVMAVLAFFSVVPIVLTAKPVWAATPVITAPATASGTEGSPIATITATATDADPANTLTITRTGEPASLTFTHVSGVSPRTATISGTLAPGDAAGSPYYIVWTVNDGTGGSASVTTVLTVSTGNQAPIANPGGPYNGCVNVPVQFSGAGSTDPDAGQTLSFTWDFDTSDGIGVDATGPSPSHTYAAAGTYTVQLTVTDNGSPPLSSSKNTTVTVVAALGALKVTTKKVNLTASGSFVIKFSPNPVGAWNLSDWDQTLSSNVLTVAGFTGSITAFRASIETNMGGGLGSPRGVVEFSNADLSNLMSGFMSKTYVSVSMVLEVRLITGCTVRIPFSIEVKRS